MKTKRKQLVRRIAHSFPGDGGLGGDSGPRASYRTFMTKRWTRQRQKGPGDEREKREQLLEWLKKQRRETKRRGCALISWTRHWVAGCRQKWGTASQG